MDLFSSSDSDSDSPPLRPKANGVMAFHAGTEQALLAYLSSAHPEPVEKGRAQVLLDGVDRYCVERHWMMHVGDGKSRILRDALALAVEGFTSRLETKKGTAARDSRTTFRVLELGTYCGYSAVKMALYLSELLPPGVEVRVHSIEIDPANAAVAREVVRLAGMEDVVEVMVEGSVERGVEKARASSGEAAVEFGAVFIDHDKDDYLSDLLSLLSLSPKVLPPGSVVIADNVLMGRIDDYRDYVGEEAKREGGAFKSTELMMGRIEYSEPDGDVYGEGEMEDGVEVSVVR